MFSVDSNGIPTGFLFNFRATRDMLSRALSQQEQQYYERTKCYEMIMRRLSFSREEVFYPDENEAYGISQKRARRDIERDITEVVHRLYPQLDYVELVLEAIEADMIYYNVGDYVLVDRS